MSTSTIILKAISGEQRQAERAPISITAVVMGAAGLVLVTLAVAGVL